MEFPIRYIFLIDFLLNKRDVARDGVKGYELDISFTMNEMNTLGLPDKSEVLEMLDIMKTEKVWVPDEDGEKHQITVLDAYKQNGDNIILHECTTAKLVQFKKKIKNDLTESTIECDNKNNPTAIRYRGDEWSGLSKGKRRCAFRILYRNFPEAVSYKRIWKEICGHDNPPPLEVKKVLNAVNGLRRRMIKYGFPVSIIKNHEKEGKYQLTE